MCLKMDEEWHAREERRGEERGRCGTTTRNTTNANTNEMDSDRKEGGGRRHGSDISLISP